MRTKLTRQGRGLVLAVLTLMVSMPELARAQQSGLLPNAPIRRQRVPCDQEDSVYKIYKEKYFGYHPTCWRTFPSGWGCPSPEKPDVAKAFRERKVQTIEGGLGAPDEGMPGEQPGVRPDVPRPDLPGAGRSPFDVPAPDGNNPAVPREERKPASPFDLQRPDNPPAAAPNAPRAGRTAPSIPPIGEGGPELSAPDQPARASGARTSRYTPQQANGSREVDGPLLALPEVNLPAIGGPETPFGTQPAEPGAMTAEANGAQVIPANSAPRRGFLSGLFNNLGWNWARR